ncbi:uncharacterized protein LOC134211989 isoform X2 [Armigeres subalbatus]|uniref:uncharacterized protein LOC134211989 isoform X2 n=1 Tax=Armigeres subalbatus TaxID=124917 RepID=UPI002ED2816F
MIRTWPELKQKDVTSIILYWSMDVLRHVLLASVLDRKPWLLSRIGSKPVPNCGNFSRVHSGRLLNCALVTECFKLFKVSVWCSREIQTSSTCSNL